MTDNLARALNPPERDDLYAQLTKASTSYKPNTKEAKKQSEDYDENSFAVFNDEEPVDLSIEDEERGSQQKTWIKSFQELKIFHRLWYYFLSFFSRKPAETLFRQEQLDLIRQEIRHHNNELIIFDRESKIHLISSYLPNRFNTVFKSSLEVLPIINQVDRNTKFMTNIVQDLIFSTYRSGSGQSVRTDTAYFVSPDDLSTYVFMGDVVTKQEIDNLMHKVAMTSKSLPYSLYKFALTILLPLYQFQKICYFPFSNFFNIFRTDSKNKNDLYSNILPQETYDSISMLHQLIHEVGPIDVDKNIFRKIINSYFSIAEEKGSIRIDHRTAVDFHEAFIRLQTIWNSFIQKVPIDNLLLLVAENPYQERPLINNMTHDILKLLPKQIEKIYQGIVLTNINAEVQDLRGNRKKILSQKYLLALPQKYSKFYSNKCMDFLPSKNFQDSEDGPFAHCESFFYIKNFLYNYCTDNIVKPLQILNKGVFKSDNYIYETTSSFLGNLEKSKTRLEIFEQSLHRESRLHVNIKEAVLRIDQRVEGAEEEYTTLIMNIDREIRMQMEEAIKELQEFSQKGLSAIETAIEESSFEAKFRSFIPQFQYMSDFHKEGPNQLTSHRILELWKQYIAEFTSLLHDQLEKERAGILSQISRVASIRSRQK